MAHIYCYYSQESKRMRSKSHYKTKPNYKFCYGGPLIIVEQSTFPVTFSGIHGHLLVGSTGCSLLFPPDTTLSFNHSLWAMSLMHFLFRQSHYLCNDGTVYLKITDIDINFDIWYPLWLLLTSSWGTGINDPNIQKCLLISENTKSLYAIVIVTIQPLSHF